MVRRRDPRGPRPGPAPIVARAEVPGPSIAAKLAATLDRDWCAPLRQGGIPHRLLVRAGTPVAVLHDIVEVEKPDLLVLGTARRRARVGVGQHQPRRARRAPGPHTGGTRGRVRGRGGATGHRGGGPGPVHVGCIDGSGSAASLRALDLAVDLAEPAGGDIVAVTIVEDVPVFPLGPATALTSEGKTDAPARTAAMLAAACAPARARGLHVHTVCRRGTPATLLLRLATVLDADLMAIGTRGVGAPDHPMLGSVSRRLVCDSPRPVLVVPVTAAPPPASGTTRTPAVRRPAGRQPAPLRSRGR